MVHNRDVRTNLKAFNITDLFDHPMILLDFPVLVMDMLKVRLTELVIVIIVRQVRYIKHL